MSVPIFPTINATLNGLAGVFLLLGYRAIRQRKDAEHKRWMLCALACSTLFLVSYITYHILIHGVTKYPGTGLIRNIYYFILGTHTPLAMIIVPASGFALYHAFNGNFPKHTRITRWLWPVWMYVSLTGVVIYLMLYVFKPV